MKLSHQQVNPRTGGGSYLLRLRDDARDTTACLLVDSGTGVDLDAMLGPDEHLAGVLLTHAHLGFSRPEPLVGTENDVLGRRSGAAIIDSVAAFFVGFAGAVLFALADIALTGDAVASFDVWSGFAVAPFCYFALTEAYFGRTLGKRLFGLVVVAEDGTTASRRSILARNLLRPLDFLPCYGLGVLSMSISERSQRIGDMAADTVVVRSARGR